MGSRLDLQDQLEDILGSSYVYFQPPANVHMSYPCIVYERDRAITQFAGNRPYKYTKRYQVTHISRDPDATVPDLIATLPMCLHSRSFRANGLNHDVFTLYH